MKNLVGALLIAAFLFTVSVPAFGAEIVKLNSEEEAKAQAKTEFIDKAVAKANLKKLLDLPFEVKTGGIKFARYGVILSSAKLSNNKDSGTVVLKAGVGVEDRRPTAGIQVNMIW